MITAIDKNTALVLIDLQKGIVNTSTAHPSHKIVANAARLAEAFRKEELPVIIVNVNPIGSPFTLVRAQQNNQPKDPEGQKQALEKMNASGFFDIVPELGAAPGDIRITKRTWNAFFQTSLDEELKRRSVTGIVLAGISTSIGVEGTARSASERGYNISFAEDAMTDLVLASHERSLQYIFPRIGEIGSTDTIISKLTERI